MFEISNDAMEYILVRLDSAMEGRPELRRNTKQVGLRLDLRKDRAHLSLAFPRPTDRVITFMGRTVLIMDPEDFSRLESARLTVATGLAGKSLSMEPNTPVQVA